jgi:hypothetical protein
MDTHTGLLSFMADIITTDYGKGLLEAIDRGCDAAGRERDGVLAGCIAQEIWKLGFSQLQYATNGELLDELQARVAGWSDWSDWKPTDPCSATSDQTR